MANSRIMLTCKHCGEQFVIGKGYGGSYRTVNEKIYEQLNEFYAKHSRADCTDEFDCSDDAKNHFVILEEGDELINFENGVVVPQQYVDIKIGQVVYMVYPTRIRELKVHNINYNIEKTGCSIYYYCEVLNENVCDLFFLKDIGYTTFLTKEEAEAKLREYNNETK